MERKDLSIDREKLRKEGFPEPTPLSKELVNSLPEEQRRIIFTLADLAEEEKKLVDEINTRRPTESGILRERGGITLCEDEDDWIVHTMGFRMKLDGVKARIKQTLNEALDCGLGFLGVIQRQCANYGVKP